MIDNQLSPGDSLPLALSDPSPAEVDRVRRGLRQMLIQAPTARGCIMGIDVETLDVLDRALAFDWLWDQLQRANHIARPPRFK